MKRQKQKVLYISAMFDYDSYQKLFTLEKKPMHAANKFHTLLARGLVENSMEVIAYSSLPVSRENCKKKYVKIPKFISNGVTYSYISVFNFPGIRHVQLFLKSFFKALFSPKNTVVIYDTLVVTASYGAVLGAKLCGKKSIAIVTDLPQFMPIASNSKMLKMNDKLLKKADGYVFLTEQMNDAVNSKNKPYVVVEGLVDRAMAQKEHKPFNDDLKKVIYAGSLQKKYGIADLCLAFVACEFDNAELHIYGDGDYAEELRRLANEHKNIIYHGNCLNDEVVEAELEASLLVNPRPAVGEYTKYSFPSKTLEYMVSGTPVLTARLEGIPKDYEPYLYFFENGQEGIEKEMREILSQTRRELSAMGEKARRFALDEKNNNKQVEKIANLIGEMKK